MTTCSKTTAKLKYQTFLDTHTKILEDTHHITVDMNRPTPMQSTKTTHSNSFRVSRSPMSSTKPKPTVETVDKQVK